MHTMEHLRLSTMAASLSPRVRSMWERLQAEIEKKHVEKAETSAARALGGHPPRTGDGQVQAVVDKA
jgi:hypothetical protein